MIEPYYMNLPSIEDENRYSSPPEDTTGEPWPEPEDHCDYIDTLSTQDTP